MTAHQALPPLLTYLVKELMLPIGGTTKEARRAVADKREIALLPMLSFRFPDRHFNGSGSSTFLDVLISYFFTLAGAHAHTCARTIPAQSSLMELLLYGPSKFSESTQCYSITETKQL